jgi:predicted amidophosphoribosyltransferase
VLDALIALVAPPRCLACTAGTRAGERLCAECRAELPWLRDPCPRCGLPRLCGPPCPAARAAFATAWAPLAFEGPARSLVHALKFRGLTAAAHVMAAQMAANVPPELLGEARALVPVPTSPDRHRGRGFDHTRLLARHLGKRLQLPSLGALTVQSPAPPQIGRSAAQRRQAAPSMDARRCVEGLVALVDDVHTTGATLDAGARALRAAGADRVVAVTYARTLG